MLVLKRSNENDKDDKELVTKTVGVVEDTIERMSRIISGLRTMTRESSSDENEVFPIVDVLKDVLSLCTQKFKIHEINLKFDLESEMFDYLVKGDRVHLSQVFLNLIGNSYDAISSMDDKWIDISVLKINDIIQIRVIDSGSGIPPEVADKMFNPFFTSKDVGHGTGLGLSISRNIIKNSGGEIYIDEKCKNTCFVIELPYCE